MEKNEARFYLGAVSGRYRCHFTLSMTRIGERAPHRWRSTRLEGIRDGHCWTVSALWITFLASCQDLTPVRPPVTAADQGPDGAASGLDHRGVDAVDAGAWIPRLCLV
jgi:hypothetical protein